MGRAGRGQDHNHSGRWTPWDESRTLRAWIVLLVVGAAMTGLDTLLLPDPTSSVFARLVQHAFPFLQAGLAAGLVIATRAGVRVPARGWIVFAVSAVVVIAAEAMVTEDASASSQLLLFFPLLFAATQLRPAAAHVVTALTIAVHVLEVVLLLPPGDAARDALYGALAYGAVGILITHGAAAQHRLTECSGSRRPSTR